MLLTGTTKRSFVFDIKKIVFLNKVAVQSEFKTYSKHKSSVLGKLSIEIDLKNIHAYLIYLVLLLYFYSETDTWGMHISNEWE